MTETKTKTIYLDNAATSWPKPPAVIEAVSRFLADCGGSSGRAGHRASREAERIVLEARTHIAKMLGVDDPYRIAACFNGTDALNIAIKGTLNEGDHVVCTAVDHNSVSRPLEAMARRGFITLTRLAVGEDGCIDPADVADAMTPATKLVTVSHASNVTGVIQPITKVGQIVRERGLLFLVDAAQTVGVLELSIAESNADFVAFPCHKSLLGPPGLGALYAGPRTDLRPFREGGTGADSENPVQPSELPTRLEAGSTNVAGWAGFCAAFAHLTPEKSLKHERGLLSQMTDALANVEGVHVVGNPDHTKRVGVMSINIDGYTPQEVAAILDESFDIAVRPGLHCAPYMHRALGTFPDGAVRIAPGPFTTPDQMARVCDALSQIASVAESVTG